MGSALLGSCLACSRYCEIGDEDDMLIVKDRPKPYFHEH